MSNKIGEIAFNELLKDFFSTFESDADIGRVFGFAREYIGQMRRGVRPANEKIVKAMGYTVDIEKLPPIRTYRRVTK